MLKYVLKFITVLFLGNRGKNNSIKERFFMGRKAHKDAKVMRCLKKTTRILSGFYLFNIYHKYPP